MSDEYIYSTIKTDLYKFLEELHKTKDFVENNYGFKDVDINKVYAVLSNGSNNLNDEEKEKLIMNHFDKNFNKKFDKKDLFQLVMKTNALYYQFKALLRDFDNKIK